MTSHNSKQYRKHSKKFRNKKIQSTAVINCDTYNTIAVNKMRGVLWKLPVIFSVSDIIPVV